MSETTPPAAPASAAPEDATPRRIVSEDLPLSIAAGVATAVVMSLLDVGAAWALAGVVVATFVADAIKTELRSRGWSKRRLGVLTLLLLLLDRVKSAFGATPREKPPAPPSPPATAHWGLVPVTAVLASAVVVAAFTVADVARGSALIGGGRTSFFGGGHGSSTGTVATTTSTGATTTTTSVTTAPTSTRTTATTGTTTATRPVETQLLTIVLSGTGTVVSVPPGVACLGGTCSARFPVGSSVTLSAAPVGGGSRFAGWRGGGCSGTGPCRVRVGDAMSLTAVFVPVETRDSLEVVFEKDGEGLVTSRPEGIACRKTCTAPFAAGQVVTLVARAGVGSTFDGWTGCRARATNSPACTVTVSGPTSVAAAFGLAPTVSKLGVIVTAGGRVTSEPKGIDCPRTCAAAFPTGTTVTLTAAAERGGAFSGWAGVDCSKPVCTFTLDGFKTVTADFEGPR